MTLFASVLVLALGKPIAAFQQGPREGAPAPSFNASIFAGGSISSKELRGKPAVLFFFCSCDECHQVAKEWARLQGTGQSTKTLISFSGTKQEADLFTKETSLNPGQARFMDDSDNSLNDRYDAMPCPAAFVIGSDGTLLYSSKQTAGVNETRASVLTAQVVDAIVGKHKPGSVALAPTHEPITSTDLVPVIKPGMNYSSGVVEYFSDPIDTKKDVSFSHKFTFTNQGEKPLTVDRLLTSCGCETTQLRYHGKVMKRAVVNPGEQVEVMLKVSLKPGSTGYKTVRVSLCRDEWNALGIIVATIYLGKPK